MLPLGGPSLLFYIHTWQQTYLLASVSSEPPWSSDLAGCDAPSLKELHRHYRLRTTPRDTSFVSVCQVVLPWLVKGNVDEATVSKGEVERDLYWS